MKKLYTILGAALLAASVSFPAMALDVATSMTEWTLSPADGAEVSSLEVIEVTFPQPADGIECGVYQYGNYITLTCGDKVYRATKAKAKEGDYQTGQITFERITTPGVYTLHIANGVFYDYEMAEMSDNENDPYPTHPDITATYTIIDSGTSGVVGANPMTEYESMPMEGDAVEEISVVELAFPAAAGGIELAGAADDIVLLDGTLFVSECESVEFEDEVAIINLLDQVTDAGSYELVIPAGMFKATGTDFTNEEIRLHFTIEGSDQPGENKMTVYTVDPTDGSTLDEISRIDIAFTEVADGIDQYGSFSSLIVKLNGELIDTNYQMVMAGSNYEVLGIVFIDALTAPGQYEITVPEGTVRDYTSSGDNADVNPEIVLHYTVSIGSGVTAVEAAPAVPETVYDLSGRALRSSRLDAGLYIVNGKKIVIRK